MAAGNDPFPHEEVTGLAAFENLPQVSSILMPDEVPDTDGEDSLEDPRDDARQHSPTQSAAQSQRVPKRGEPTLQIGHHAAWQPPEAEGTLHTQDVPELQDDLAESTNTHDLGADHLFDDSLHGTHRDHVEQLEHSEPASSPHDDGDGDWEEDGATRVVHDSAMIAARAHHASTLDWDEDEPATAMRPEAMFEAAPVSAPEDWDDAGTELYQRSMVPPPQRAHARVAAAEASAADAAFDAEEPSQASQTMSGGRPSPFPARTQAAGARPSAAVSQGQRHGHDNAPGHAVATAQTPAGLFDALKSGHRHAWQLVAAVAVGFFALVLIVRGLGGGAKPATVTVSSSPADAKLIVDGHEVDVNATGGASPFSVVDLKPGHHTIVASKPGFTEYRGSFEVAAGETKALPAIELTQTEVGFAIRSSPSGAAVVVDGQVSDQVTPARVVGMAPGIHNLQLKLEGYAPWDLKVFVPDGTLLQLPAAELVANGDSERADADKAARYGRGAKRLFGRDRDHDDSDHGSRDESGGDSDSDDESTRPVRRWHARTSSPHTSSYASAAIESDKPERAEKPVKAEPAPLAESAPVATSSKLGTLRINSRPWAQVSVDGKVVGNTPQTALQLSAGVHKVQLVNPQMGMSKTVQIRIPAGQIVTQVLNLAD